MTSVFIPTATILLFVCHVALSRSQTMDASDKAAITAVREAMENKELFPAIECGYLYFQCDGSGRVTQINIGDIGLRGRIAEEIGNLPLLTFLRLSNNKLSGSIPWSIERLKSLKELYITNNLLSGNIPSSICKMTSLLVLYLHSNRLNGTIPWNIGQMTSLEYLYLYNNQLSGSIPVSIGQLKSLQYLWLKKNKLSGSIPSSIGGMTSLQYLWLNNNKLSGSIPSSISKLKFLQYFDISNNYFTGPIVQVNGQPSCLELASNCLFGLRLPNGCGFESQRKKTNCLSFCNALQKGGPCGGKGTCVNSKDGKTRVCACNKGYNTKARKYTCAH